MRFRALTIATLLAATLAAAPAFAFPHFTTVACDTLSTTPLRVRTTFDLDLVGPGGWNWFFMDPRPVGPAPTDSTHFYSCTAPSGWLTQGPTSGSQTLLFQKMGAGFGSGEHYAGFTVVADRASPCAHCNFDTGLLDAGGNISGDGCLSLDHPVPATRSSWGKLKVAYRN